MYFKIANARVVTYSVWGGTYPEGKQSNQITASTYGSIALEGQLTNACINCLQGFLSPQKTNRRSVKVEINLKFETSFDEVTHKGPYIGEVHIEGGDVVINALLDASMFLPIISMKMELLSVYAGMRLTTQNDNKDDYDIVAANIVKNRLGSHIAKVGAVNHEDNHWHNGINI